MSTAVPGCCSRWTSEAGRAHPHPPPHMHVRRMHDLAAVWPCRLGAAALRELWLARAVNRWRGAGAHACGGGDSPSVAAFIVWPWWRCRCIPVQSRGCDHSWCHKLRRGRFCGCTQHAAHVQPIMPCSGPAAGAGVVPSIALGSIAWAQGRLEHSEATTPGEGGHTGAPFHRPGCGHGCRRPGTSAVKPMRCIMATGGATRAASPIALSALLCGSRSHGCTPLRAANPRVLLQAPSCLPHHAASRARCGRRGAVPVPRGVCRVRRRPRTRHACAAGMHPPAIRHRPS